MQDEKLLGVNTKTSHPFQFKTFALEISSGRSRAIAEKRNVPERTMYACIVVVLLITPFAFLTFVLLSSSLLETFLGVKTDLLGWGLKHSGLCFRHLSWVSMFNRLLSDKIKAQYWFDVIFQVWFYTRQFDSLICQKCIKVFLEWDRWYNYIYNFISNVDNNFQTF